MTSTSDHQLTEEAELRRLSLRYAQACDRCDGPALGALFTEDALLHGPGFRSQGRKDITENIAPFLKRLFLKTVHLVHNVLTEISGSTAVGETYCFAHHITQKPDGSLNDYIMAITYKDRFEKQAGRWLIKERELVLNWTENRPVEKPQSV